MSSLLCLSAPPTDWNNELEKIATPLSGYPFSRNVEAAGAAHLALVTRRSRGIMNEEDGFTNEDEDNLHSSQDEEEEENIGARARKARSQRKKKSKSIEDDYYELLELGHLRWTATEQDIKKAYRKMILNHHPDKQAQSKDTVDDDVFKSISEAYECLSNEEKRRIYDSKDNFDDCIPTEQQAQNTEDFYALFGPVFRRNSKWSVDKAVPPLGSQVEGYHYAIKFYDFWRSFKSWREFSAGDDEFDLEDAQSRDEKRWMDRQNKKVTNKLKKEDYARIMLLVNIAYRYDPRIIQWKEEQEREKERKKQEKKLAKQQRKDAREQEVALARKAEEEKVRKEQEKLDDEAKQQALQNKKIRKKRPHLRKLCRAAREKHTEDAKTNPFFPKEDHTEVLCQVMNLEQFNALINEFLNGNGPQAFREMLVFHKLISEDDVYFGSSSDGTAKVVQKVEKEISVPKKNSDWSPAEIILLTKALTKYPVGTRNRNQLAAEAVGTRTVKEVIAQTKRGKTETAQEQSMTKQDAFTRFKETKKEAKITKVVAPTIVAKHVAPESTEPESWSPDEQKALEAAMKKFGSKEGDRWNKIAGEIPNRSKEDCVARYKYLVDFFKRQKALKQKK